jgi:CYTH domain-containing protein
MGTNPARYDTVEQAQQRDAALIEAWRDHPNWVFVSAEGGMDAVIDRVLAAVSPLMDLEIERKFLLSHIPIEVIAGATSKRIEQYYLLCGGHAEVRVRRYDGNLCEMCVKDNGTWSRLEWESRIPTQVFDLLVQAYNCPCILKTRYYIPHGESTLELDVYDKPERLCTLECEFHDEKSAREFVLPAWAATATEVTDDPAYKNAALAAV